MEGGMGTGSLMKIKCSNSTTEKKVPTAKNHTHLLMAPFQFTFWEFGKSLR